MASPAYASAFVRIESIRMRHEVATLKDRLPLDAQYGFVAGATLTNRERNDGNPNALKSIS